MFSISYILPVQTKTQFICFDLCVQARGLSMATMMVTNTTYKVPQSSQTTSGTVNSLELPPATVSTVCSLPHEAATVSFLPTRAATLCSLSTGITPISPTRSMGAGGRPTLRCILRAGELEVEEEFLFDTGSSLTFVRSDVARTLLGEMCMDNSRPVLLADGSERKVCILPILKLVIGGTALDVKIHVGPGFGSLLGRDVLDLLWGRDWSNLSPTPETPKHPSRNNPRHQVAGVASPKEAFTREILGSTAFSSDRGLTSEYARIQLKKDARPRFVKARPAPFAIRDSLKKALDAHVADGTMVRVDTSEWASPIVPVLKPDGTIRVCGDYSGTVNPAVDTTVHPLPTTEECIAAMAGGKIFTKIDLKSAYTQVPLEQRDKELLTLNTPFGLYQWTRLPYGLSSSSGIFQRIMDHVLQGLPKVVCRVDDILIQGSSDHEHQQIVREVVRRLEKAGLRARTDKTEIMVKEVTYLGYRIGVDGVRAVGSKVETLAKMQFPANRPKLLTWLGAVGYYARFIPNLATLEEPFKLLRKQDSPWKVTNEHRKAFQRIQEEIMSARTLTMYDPKRPIVLDTDASAYGIGGVLSQIEDGVERPIEFFSRTLTSAERNYSQLEKEALGIVWGVKRMTQYLYGREFVLRTDAEPLTTILNPEKAISDMATSRIKRWKLVLANYQYTIKYRPTAKHANADLCSRFPLPYAGSTWSAGLPSMPSSVNAVEQVVNTAWVSTVTRNDPLLTRIIHFTLNGWPDRDRPPEWEPFYKRRHELSVEDGCLLWGSRVVIPERIKSAIPKMLHIAHQGAAAMKRLARGYLWYPKLDEDLERIASSCAACQQKSSNPPKQIPHPWESANQTWDRIHIDFCRYADRDWLVVIDSFSKWLEVIDMNQDTTSAKLIRKMKILFATYGLPGVVCSDNGPQLVSEEYKKFLAGLGVRRVSIAPWSPKSNGQAESAVKVFKHAMEKNEDLPLFDRLRVVLEANRTTPHSQTGVTPAVRMFGRQLRTPLSQLNPLLVSKKPGDDWKLYRSRFFEEGDSVFAKHHGRWLPGKVTEKIDYVLYRVKCGDKLLTKHVDQLKRNCTDKEDDPEPEPPVDFSSGNSDPDPDHDTGNDPDHDTGNDPDHDTGNDPDHDTGNSSSPSNSVPSPTSVSHPAPTTQPPLQLNRPLGPSGNQGGSSGGICTRLRSGTAITPPVRYE